MHDRRTVRAQRRPGEATVGRQLHIPERLRYPLGQLSKPCNLRPLAALWGHLQPVIPRGQSNGNEPYGNGAGAHWKHPSERPASPRTASGGGTEPSSHAWSVGLGSLFISRAEPLGATPTLTVRFREPYGNGSRETDVFEAV